MRLSLLPQKTRAAYSQSNFGDKVEHSVTDLRTGIKIILTEDQAREVMRFLNEH